MSVLKLVSSNRCFGGFQKVYSHDSKILKCSMKFAIYLPPNADADKKVPVLYWLSGLTCTEENFVHKAGAQRYAAEHGIAIVGPDTSPRGCKIEGEEDSWDFGTGAGFYLDATQPKWKENYQMFSYVTQELPAVINENFPVQADRQAISGHSMGGHGALICALKCPGQYTSVSALAPICHPVQCAWGKKAFAGYLGEENKAHWEDYDATCLLAKYQGHPLEILIDQGKEDGFLKDGQLLPEKFVTACRDNKMPLIYRAHEDYDHSYYFIASFIGEHIAHHAKHLFAS